MNQDNLVEIIQDVQKYVNEGYSIRYSTRKANSNTSLDILIRRHPLYVEMLNEYKARKGKVNRWGRDEKGRIVSVRKAI